MRRPGAMLAAALALGVLPALAEPPQDIVGLIGQPVSSAEGRMQAQGYAQAGGRNWWNAASGVCVTVGVADGHFRTIDIVGAGNCGMQAAAEGAGAPATEPPRVAVDACMEGTDRLLEEEIGTSLVKRYRRSGRHWVVTVGTLGRTTQCTVSESGEIIALD
ncbi:hypothetical protein [Mesorhizobium sp. 10J20-29]